jgi:DNA-binding GntR family transcriptional regulator
MTADGSTAIDATEELDRTVPVVESIRDAIVNGDFAPRQRLVEADLSEQFGASRAAVRTALVQLTSEGLVERVQNRGARVRAVSLAEAIEITEVRVALESLCAAKAAALATDEDRDGLRDIGERMRAAVGSGDLLGYSDLNRALHDRIRMLSGQATAQAVLARLRGQNVRHAFRLAMHPGRPAVSLPQHLEMIDAVCAGDPDRAAAAVKVHLESVIEALPEVDRSGPRRV